MNRRLKISWIITVIAIVGIFAWQALSIVNLYQSQNEKFITRVNNKMIRAIHELNVIAAQRLTSISIDELNTHVCIGKKGKVTKCLIQSKDELEGAEYRAMYDIRDTAVWSLDKLYVALHRRLKIKDEILPVVFRILDSTGNVIEHLEKGHIQHRLKVKGAPVKLGFGENHVLVSEFMFPIYHFGKRMKNSVIIFFALLLLLVSCIMILMFTISREKERVIGQHLFIDTVVHNLYSPLGYMSGVRGIIEENYKDTMQEIHQRMLERVKEKQEDMGRAINRLLILSDVFHRIVIYPREFNLKEMFDKLSTLNFVEIPRDKKVKLNMCFDLKNPFVFADPVYLPVIFENLIGNAIKYSGEVVVIDITCREQGNRIIIRIKDNGMGISPRGLKHIFDIYYREPVIREDDSRKGFGIGLSFVYSAVRAHHGKIKVSSVLKAGTEFCIILPRELWKRKWMFCTRKMMRVPRR